MTASEPEALPSVEIGFAAMEVIRAGKTSRKKDSKGRNENIMLRVELSKI